MKRKNRKIKSFSAFVLALLFAVSLLDAVSMKALYASAAGIYNVSGAIEYAKAHWNDGKGLCAEFVSNCVKRGGGINEWDINCTPLIGKLEKYGTKYELKLHNNKVRLVDNIGKIDVGDPLFWYCANCRRYPHTAICNGASAQGNIVQFSHNSAKNGYVEVNFGNCYMCDNKYAAIYSIHLNPEVEVDAVQNIITEKKFYQKNENVTITWDAVENANDYIVVMYKDNECCLNEDVGNVTSYTFSAESGDYSVYIWSSNGKDITTSRCCEFCVGYVEAPKIKNDTNYCVEGESVNISWNECQFADWYNIKVYYEDSLITEENKMQERSFDISTSLGKYSVVVEAVSDDPGYEQRSSTVSFEAIKKLEGSVLSYSYDKTKQMAVFNWNEAVSADYYDIIIKNKHTGQKVISEKLEQLSYSTKLEAGEYTACVLTRSEKIPTMSTESNYVDFEVYAKVSSASFDCKEYVVKDDSTFKLPLATQPAMVRDSITWKSSDVKIASVSSDGTVTPVKVGTVKISAIVGDISATCFVKVVPSLSFEPVGTSIRLYGCFGLRYAFKLAKDSEYRKTSIIEYGTLFIKSDDLGDKELEIDTENVKKVKAVHIYSESYTQLSFTGVLVNIPDDMLEKKVTARGYLIYKDCQGKNQVIYSPQVESSFMDTAAAAIEMYKSMGDTLDDDDVIKLNQLQMLIGSKLSFVGEGEAAEAEVDNTEHDNSGLSDIERQK